MKMLLNVFLLNISALLLVCASCKDEHTGEPLSIRNNAEYRVYYWFSYWGNENFDLYHYPDTILPEDKPVYINSIAPHNAIGDGESDPNWEEIFSRLKGGKFSVYFFKSDPENQSDWDLIRENYDIYRKDVSFVELTNNNYTITYP